MLTFKSIMDHYYMDTNQHCACGQCERSSLVNLLIIMMVICSIYFSVVSEAAFTFGIVCGWLIMKKRMNIEQHSAALPDPYFFSMTILHKMQGYTR